MAFGERRRGDHRGDRVQGPSEGYQPSGDHGRRRELPVRHHVQDEPEVTSAVFPPIFLGPF